MQSALKSVIGPKKHIHDLAGQVVLVTGGALGIGLVYRSPKLVSLLLVPIAQREYDTNFGER
jgi:hypothetical protein